MVGLKKIIFGTVIAALITNNSLFAMQNKLAQIAGMAFCGGALMYVITKVGAKVYEGYFEGVPKEVEQWIRKILTDAGVQNAHSVPLKIGPGWAVCGGSFIMADEVGVKTLGTVLGNLSNNENNKIIRSAEHSVLHEGKHYNNADTTKGLFLSALIYAPFFDGFFNNTLCLYHSLSPILWIVSAIAYTRYQEAEADRFAFMNCSSVETLEKVKDNIVKLASNFENNLLFDNSVIPRNWLDKIVRPVISEKLKALGEDEKNTDCASGKQGPIGMGKDGLINVASFARDWNYPSLASKARLAQECLELRKKQLVEKNSKVDFALLK